MGLEKCGSVFGLISIIIAIGCCAVGILTHHWYENKLNMDAGKVMRASEIEISKVLAWMKDPKNADEITSLSGQMSSYIPNNPFGVSSYDKFDPKILDKVTYEQILTQVDTYKAKLQLAITFGLTKFCQKGSMTALGMSRSKSRCVSNKDALDALKRIQNMISSGQIDSLSGYGSYGESAFEKNMKEAAVKMFSQWLKEPIFQKMIKSEISWFTGK